MTKALPFTVASVARAIKGVEHAGLYVVGISPNGTLLVAKKPLDTTSLVPEIEETTTASVYEDKVG